MYGQQNPGDYDEVMARLNQTKPVVDRDPFIGPGQHSLIVLAIDTFNDQKWGQTVRATFYVEKSTYHPPGSQVVKLWNLFKPSKFPTQPNDADQFADFICKLTGVPEGQHATHCRAVLKSRAQGGNAESQPARGARITATGVEVGKPNERGSRYVRVSWQSVQQSDEQLAATRAKLDAERPYQMQQPVQQAQPQMMQQPPATQYQQQYTQPQTMQQIPMQPVQPVQGFVQQPAQGAPAGGFLAMLPNGGR